MKFPFGMMPPFMSFMMQNQQEERPTPPPDIIVPARVRLALEFMAALTNKTAARAAVTEHHVELIPGQKLTDEETTAQATACNLLSQYFAGKLNPDKWEEIRYTQLKKQAEIGGGQGTCIRCMACGPHPQEDCPLCQGRGSLLVQPLGPDPQQSALSRMMQQTEDPEQSDENNS